MIKKVLLLGGSGFLGQQIAQKIEKTREFSITIGDIQKPNKCEAPFFDINVLNSCKVNDAISSHDIIINCTGQITNPISTCLKINTEGINNIINSVKINNKKLFQISTVSVFGSTRYADENTELNPESPYATCKSFSEYMISEKLSSKSLCILRLPNLYGESQSKGLFAYLLRSYFSDRKLNFNNNGTLLRNFLHVEDCADAIFLALRKNLDGCFNIGTPDHYSLVEIIAKIEKQSGIVFDKKFSNNLPIDNIEELNISLFKHVTSFQPQNEIIDYIERSFI